MEWLRKDADEIINAGIRAVLPDEAVRRALQEMPCPSGRLILVAAGKAHGRWPGPLSARSGRMPAS